MVSRLHRMRRRFEELSANSLNTPSHLSMNYLAMASRALGGPERRRMRHRRLPTTRPTPRDHQEPIYPRKKCAIWTRWRPVPVKNVIDTQCTGALDVLTDTIIPAQFSVANGITVSAVETRAFHREARFSPGDQCYHWNNNCESYWRVGVAMGESMLELISRRKY